MRIRSGLGLLIENNFLTLQAVFFRRKGFKLRIMILIADGGATKTDWALVDDKGDMAFFSSRGMNPYNVSTDTMRKEIEERIVPNVPVDMVEAMFIYASGCSAKEKQREVIDWFAPFFPNTRIEVEGDLLGAARACCGKKAGMAAILGTGSNSCLYDGERIVENVPSLGYVLCDEGAGTNIGKLLLRDYLRGRMPKEVSEMFAQRYKGEETDFLNRLYKGEAPNYYLASFASFVIENKTNPYCREVICRAFRDFFMQQISTYSSYNKYVLNIVGSIGSLAEEELRQVAKDFEVEIGKVIKAPLKALVQFHINQNAFELGEN